MYIPVTLYLIAKEEGGRGGSKNFVVLKLQPVNLKRFLAVKNRYQDGQVHLTTKGQFDSWEYPKSSCL